MPAPASHLGEDGRPCTLHPDLSTQRLYELALLGSRMPGFHHDAASKLQSLMMALDEISEVASEADGTLRPAIDTAQLSLRELHHLLTTNRALAKPPQPVNVEIAELVKAAAERVGVKLRAELDDAEVRVPVAAMTHALAQLLDLAAGPSHLGRTVDVTITSGERVTVTIVGPHDAAKSPAAPEVLALAAFVLEREQGTVTCGGDGERFRVHLPPAESGQLRTAP